MKNMIETIGEINVPLYNSDGDQIGTENLKFWASENDVDFRVEVEAFTAEREDVYNELRKFTTKYIDIL